MDTKTRSGVAIGLVSITALFATLLYLTNLANNAPIDFFESYLKISPDGGDGSIELLFLLATSIFLATAWRVAVK